jgi:hypothetical protein
MYANSKNIKLLKNKMPVLHFLCAKDIVIMLIKIFPTLDIHQNTVDMQYS